MNATQVETRCGIVQGDVEHGVRVWKGIPYAKPPVGELRFQPPVAPEAWTGVRDATAFGHVCPQPVGFNLGMPHTPRNQSEDCLTLNVWAPAQTDGKLRPVLFWIHGGAFATGTGSSPLYDGTQFVQRGDLVVVTINYRLGALGFLHVAHLSEAAVSSGSRAGFHSNVGLLDQAAALRWVQENIAAFGGDPERVTIFGESAGSMSVAALLAMPAAKGLFQQAILQSGASQVIPNAFAEQVTRRFLAELGIEAADVHRLREVPVEEILRVQEKMRAENPTMLYFQPVVDAASLPQAPLDAIKPGAAAGIPILIGTNRDEGKLFVRPEMPVVPDEMVAQLLAVMIQVDLETAGKLARQYSGSTEAQARLVTDTFFWRCALQFASEQGKHAPVWMYRFDWTQPSHPLFCDAIHAGEIAFVFHTVRVLQIGGVVMDEETLKLAERMQDAWIAFATTGQPSTSELPWPQYEEGHRSTMVFDRECSVVDDPDAEKRKQLLSV